MMQNKCIKIDDVFEAVVELVGDNLIVGTPLGIGKPNPLLNLFWSQAKKNPAIQLEVCTALSLQIPHGKSLLEKNFLTPFVKRIFGDYPELEYINDVAEDRVPENMKLTEFYMQSGKMLNSSMAQRNYVSSNYTHAARDMVDKGMNVLLQMVAVKETAEGRRYSLSCNTDMTLDIFSIAKRKGLTKPLMVAMVNPQLPFMDGVAEVEESFFDILVDEPKHHFKPFATPRAPVNIIDYSIGLHASALVKDGGTLQVGIGSLGDALIYSTQLRHQKNKDYAQLLNELGVLSQHSDTITRSGDTKPFETGLYAASEMFVEGFAHLYDSGVLKRKVYPDAEIQSLLNQNVLSEKIPPNVIELLLQHEVLDEFITKKQLKRLQHLGILKSDLIIKDNQIQDSDGRKFDVDLFHYENIQRIQQHCLGTQMRNGVLLHGAFFLGSPWFYQWLHGLSEEQRKLFQMTPVSQVNELYGGEALDRVQRVKARFINTCMKVDLLGAAASDTLDNHQVVSGVGGQYNFVAMAHALEDSRSILMLRSTHSGKDGPQSNIVWKYPYCTIPRHLRDLVITEYGIADLRGLSDEECVKQMICIADSQFQESLRQTAVKYNKLSANWQIPEAFKNNTLQTLKSKFAPMQNKGYFPEFPFGSDFTEDELKIIDALKYLKKETSTFSSKVKLLVKAMFTKKSKDYSHLLQRMNLHEPSNREEKLSAVLLQYALCQVL